MKTDLSTPQRLDSLEPSPSVEEIRKVVTNSIDQIGKRIVGKKDVIEGLFIALLSDGHVLLEGVPGVAKTSIAETFSQTLGCSFKRIQFTPDLLPADITGTYVYNPATGDFRLRKGPIFSNIVLADEINRATPKTQAALLECMQERQVTIEGDTIQLESPFMVLATQNPIELEGTFRLPEAEIDRFMFKLSVGYPDEDEEVEILERMNSNSGSKVERIVEPGWIMKAVKTIENIYVSPSIMVYIRNLVCQTRDHPSISIGASPRASIALLKGCKVKAAISGRDFVIPDDVKSLVGHVFGHRLILKPDAEFEGKNVELIVQELLEGTPIPEEEEDVVTPQ